LIKKILGLAELPAIIEEVCENEIENMINYKTENNQKKDTPFKENQR